MKRAYESLLQKSGGRIAAEIEIETTDLYVKFFPRPKDELERLQSDSLELFQYPLDYELDTLGDYYVEAGMDYSGTGRLCRLSTSFPLCSMKSSKTCS